MKIVWKLDNLHRIGLSFGLLAFLGGCAGPVANRAFEEVANTTESRIGHRPVWIKTDEDGIRVRSTIDSLLSKALGADEAVQVALLNNRRLQGNLAELGIGAADLTSSWRPGNPGFGYSRLRRGQEFEIERSISIDALSLLFLPITAGIEANRFERTKLGAATDVLSLAAQTKRAWFEAVAAEQIAKYISQVRDSAATQAELARRMRQVGNWSALDYIREQLFYADATAKLAKSRVAASVARERLGRLMGLWGKDMSFALPDRLPVLPKVARSVENIEAAAITERLDIQMDNADVVALRKSFGLTNATRFINVLDVGYRRKSQTGAEDQRGYEVRLEVPLFDFGDAKATKAEQYYMQAVNRLTDTAINARSAAREAWLGYQTNYELAKHYQDEIIPLRQKASDEMMQRYNGMLISVFELLSDARDQIFDVTAALEALRDFWIADIDLTFVTIAPVDAAASSSGR